MVPIRLHAAHLCASLSFFAVAACNPYPQTDAENALPEEAASDQPTLRIIMQGLEADMATLAHGIWTEDGEAVGAGAAGIANHPRVAPDEMAVIQGTLGEEFPAFAAFDGRVHDAAVALEGAALTATTPEVASAYQRMQEGCITCHTTFRTRVSEALAAPEG